MTQIPISKETIDKICVNTTSVNNAYCIITDKFICGKHL